MDSEVPKYAVWGGAEFSAIQLTEEVSEILKSASAALRIKAIFKKLRHSGLEVLKDFITAFSCETFQFFCFDMAFFFPKAFSNRPTFLKVKRKCEGT